MSHTPHAANCTAKAATNHHQSRERGAGPASTGSIAHLPSAAAGLGTEELDLAAQAKRARRIAELHLEVELPPVTGSVLLQHQRTHNFAERGDLLSLLLRSSDGALMWSDRRMVRILWGIAVGLEYLREQQLMHR